jgi:hypothetical protein
MKEKNTKYSNLVVGEGDALQPEQRFNMSD